VPPTGGLAYHATARVVDTAAGPHLVVAVAVTNAGTAPVRLDFGANALRVRLTRSHGVPTTAGAPAVRAVVWDSGERRDARGRRLLYPQYLVQRELAPGDSLTADEFRLAVPVDTVLGDSLAAGEYDVTARLTLGGSPAVAPGGDVAVGPVVLRR
jgi:hypothetical protein